MCQYDCLLGQEDETHFQFWARMAWEALMRGESVTYVYPYLSCKREFLVELQKFWFLDQTVENLIRDRMLQFCDGSDLSGAALEHTNTVLFDRPQDMNPQALAEARLIAAGTDGHPALELGV